jgi:hypothetical protein
MKEIDMELEEKLKSIRADRKAQLADVQERQDAGKLSKGEAAERKKCLKGLADRLIEEAKSRRPGQRKF